jgi:thioredoxin 1
LDQREKARFRRSGAAFPSERFLASIRLGDPACGQAPSPAATFPAQREERMSENISHVTDATFEPDVLKSDTPVLVDYWAEWCGPCKAIAPILDEVAKEYGGKLKVMKLNVDENHQVPKKYNIRGIPTLMLFKNGNVEATKVGALSKSQLTAFLDSNI